MSVLIPENQESINVNYRHGNNGRDNFRVGYVGEIYDIQSNSSIVIKAIYLQEQNYLKYLIIIKINRNRQFDDAIDWGWFSFLTNQYLLQLTYFIK